MNRFTIVLALTTGVALGLHACGEDDTMRVGSRFIKSVTVGADGGGFAVTTEDSSRLAGLSLDVPAGALAEPTTLTLLPSADLPPQEEVTWIGPAADLGPDGLRFDVPVTLTLPIDAADFGDDEPVVRVVSADGATEWLTGSDLTVVDGAVRFAVDHFTTFQTGRRPTQSQCAVDADCARNEVCTQGACQPNSPPPCQSNLDCATGEVCTATGMCAPAPQCTVDTDCSRAEICSQGSCIPDPSLCRTDADCASAEICSQGSCIPDPNLCRTDADCASTEVCTQGSCVLAPGRCRTDADCATGEACTAAGICAPAPQCQVDADCATNESCAQGMCVANPPPACQTDADCATGEYCSANQTCLMGTRCMADSDCIRAGPGFVCRQGLCQ
jgi:Cys-rich repeat protein